MSTSVYSPFPAEAPKIEVCSDCGREWPARLGRHNCNFSKRHVHIDAIIVAPGADLLESVQRLTSRMESEVCRSAEYADLGGVESPYPAACGQIDAAIGHLKRFRAEMQRLAGHAHDFSERSNDYCSICGADGRA
jgi:hypothetical protein